ncbi:hypothetical protein JTB14_024290 [Gonioctena quinquepunctata]|nr:hypothetical protein JTB14_024290 [Gonioctena quinquepunctata]
METDDRNIPPDEGIKDKPPEETAVDSQEMQVPAGEIREQESKPKQGQCYMKLQFNNPLENNPVSGMEQKKGEVSPDTPEPYMDCSPNTPARQDNAIIAKNLEINYAPEQVELPQHPSMLVTNLEDNNVLHSAGENKHTSEVRRTGSSGSIASDAPETNNYGQSFTPNNSHAPSNASTTDKSIQDNEAVDNSLNQTIKPVFHVGKSPFRSRVPSGVVSESELVTSETEAQFKKPTTPAVRLRRSSKIMAIYEAKSDSETLPSPKRKREDSPDNLKNKIKKGKEPWIEDSLKLTSNKTLTASIARARAVELAENSEQLCNCGQPANQVHFLVDAENMQIHI